VLRRHLRLPGVAVTAALALAASALAGPPAAQGLSPAAAAAPGESPLTLWAPRKLVAHSWDGQVYSDLGVRVVAPEEPFELRSTRSPLYDDAISTVWRSAAGDVALPEGTLDDFDGLDRFLKVTVRRAGGTEVLKRWRQGACLNGETQRVRPEAPARSRFPVGCPWNPYTLGSVMGVEGGYASSITGEFYRPFRLAPGRYDVTTRITRTYTDLFGIDPADARRSTRVVVKEEDDFERPTTTRRPGLAQPAAQEPTGPAAAPPPGSPAPDLRSLPAWGIDLNRKGTTLRFAATVWNGGNSPLVVDGFRADGEDSMDAYQYFFDQAGEQTGYAPVGEMHWHAQNHQHWHFEDFARYRLLNRDRTEVVKSTKQSFCLANTDAVDYTVDGADWHPENTDLNTSCGGSDALSVRQVLSAGSGDTYLQYRYGQAFPLRNVPNGIYWISVEANPLRNLVESDETNNDSVRRIRIGGREGRRWVRSAPVGLVDESGSGIAFRHH
jgi:hypothetical protein